MAPSSSEQIRTLARGIGLRQVRLVSGIILFAYLVSHFVNHALGNISLEAMADGVWWHTAFWQFLPVAIVFYAACLAHAGLGLWALYERRQFRFKTMELLQLALGLSIPVLIIAHVLGVRLALTLHGHENPLSAGAVRLFHFVSGLADVGHDPRHRGVRGSMAVSACTCGCG